jgi:UDP:flavonoid glycosyltransferase YjiC (YdhE family)
MEDRVPLVLHFEVSHTSCEWRTTTDERVLAGLPTIIKPFFGDQHFYADRVATLGIGSAVRVMTVDNLATAITTAVTDEKQISRARLAGEAIRKVRRILPRASLPH